MADDENHETSATTTSTVSSSSSVNANLRKMRLEEASFRMITNEDAAVIAAVSSDKKNAPTKIDTNNKTGVILSLSLTDSVTRAKSEHVELAMTQGEVHQMLTALRGMASSIGSLSGE
jgi:hypothetical protein